MGSSGTTSAARVAELERQLATSEAARIAAEARLAASEAARARSEEALARLERMIAQLRRDKFGSRSEKASPDQQHLPFEDVEVAEGMLEAASEEVDKALGDRKTSPRKEKRNKGHLPAHLERVAQVIEPDSTLCPCGCGEMVKVGEDRSERLDVIPARFRVLVTVRPKYLCRSCDGASHVQAPAPEWLVPRGLPTEALVAHSMVSKFGDYLPFYRQADIYRRQGIDLDRSMLANWSGRAAQLLDPIIDHMINMLKRSDHLQMDETTVPVLAPGTGKVRKDYLWAILRDQRGWGGTDPPMVVFHHSRSRSGKVARDLLKGFAGGTLMVDGYTGYDSLADPKQTARPWDIAYCWTHWRRRFVKFGQDTPSPICEEMVARVSQLYAIEKEIRGKDPETRRAVRQKLSKPIIDALLPWLEARLQDLSSASDLARHIRYGLKRWDGLTRFLSDGRLEMDTNGVENAIRPIPLTRKNALFAGSDDGAETWARIASLIGTCRLNRVNPEAYVAATLRKILDQHMQSDIDELMPWSFAE
ncbi:IS66 family transposase [Psychromarinibacter sp. C21-152]|uniref:IS66 family transposase n=1 Tax=Psychromarinibacter sediminicola TaxID=3033385 RepID=A0AAE3TBI3_9RHOB|nr:IS66 family transposase [Psychromarinibacter sediminicola]MDF0603893.1 IS66 family transposase [Psychromarinibacter sediminicola]